MTRPYNLLTTEEANLVDEFTGNRHDQAAERDRLANLVLRFRALSKPPAPESFLKVDVALEGREARRIDL